MSLKPGIFGKYPLVTAAGALALVLGAGSEAWADAVKMDGVWVSQGVTVQRIEDGKIVYLVRGAETEDPLMKLEGMYLDNFPDLEAAQKALKDGKPADAARMLQRLIGTNPKHVWVRQYAEKLLMQAQDQSGKPTEMVLTYLKMANDKAPAEYLKAPPTSSLGKATDVVKKDIRVRLNTMLPKLSEEAKPGAHLFLKALGDEPAAPAPTAPAATPTTPTPVAPTPAASTGTTGTTTASTPATGAPAAAPAAATPAATPAAAAPAVVGASGTGPTVTDSNGVAVPAGLPKEIPVTVVGVQLYRDGKYDDALKWVDDQLKTAQQNFSFFFYLRGLALYAIAEKTDNQDMFLDAGVSFMKSAIYFPRDMYAGPAYLETARVYVKLGKLKEAKKLFAKAQDRLMGMEPGLDAKVEALQAALKDTSDAPSGGAKDSY
jgi:TolA-binding protein